MSATDRRRRCTRGGLSPSRRATFLAVRSSLGQRQQSQPKPTLLHSPLIPRLRPAGSQSAAAGIGTGARDLAQSAAPPTAAVAREAQPAQLLRLAARARLHRTARPAVSSLPSTRRLARSAAAFGARPPGAGGTSASIRLRLFGRNDLGLTLAAIETRRRGTGVCVHDTLRLLTALLALGPGRRPWRKAGLFAELAHLLIRRRPARLRPPRRHGIFAELVGLTRSIDHRVQVPHPRPHPPCQQQYRCHRENATQTAAILWRLTLDVFYFALQVEIADIPVVRIPLEVLVQDAVGPHEQINRPSECARSGERLT